MPNLKYTILVLLLSVSSLFAQWDSRGGGTGETNLTAGSVVFSNGISLAQDNTNFFFDNTNNRLGLGIATPTTQLHLWNNTVSGSFLPVLLLERSQAGIVGSQVIFELDSASPADNDIMGSIRFDGRDSAAGVNSYVSVQGLTADVTNTDEAGMLTFDVMMNASLRNLLTLDGYNGSVNEGEIIFNEDAQDVDLRVESAVGINALTVQGSDGFVGLGTAAPQTQLDVAGAITADLYNFAADGQANDDYEIALPGISALTTGLMVTFTATTLNTDGATLEITSVGDIDALLKGNGVALATGDITAGLPITAIFIAAGNWIIMSRLASD